MRAIALALALLFLAACGEETPRLEDAPGRGSERAAAASDERDPSAATQARVVVRSRVRHYEIGGSSALELRAGMDRLGPKDPVYGTPYAGFTRWRIEWSYDYASTAGCAIDGVVVAVRIEIVLPRWREARSGPRDLAAEWRRFIAALRRHEEGHAAIARRGGRRVARRLEALRTFPSCARLERAADAAAERIIEDTRRAERAYDRRTGHGDTQGARFPS